MQSGWRSDYDKKCKTAEAALRGIRRGQRIFIGSGCGTPQHLVRALEARAKQSADLEILHLLSLGKASFTEEAFRDKARLKSFFVASGSRQAVAEGRADYTPIYLYDVPKLFRSGRTKIDVALIQVSPPDEHGFCSYGIAVDIVKAAAESAKTVIAQVNRRMPRVLGDSFVHVSELDAIVEYDEELLEMPPPIMNQAAYQIGKHVAKLVEDGSTIRAGVGSVPNAALFALEQKRDLGVHTDMLTDAYLELVEKGVITNSRKTLHPKKIIASFCMGSRRLYDFVHDNPMVEFHPTEYTNDYFIISQNDKMVSINSALQVDLTGQVCADSMGYKIYSGVGGAVDFIRGAIMSRGGKSIIVLPSTTLDGNTSRIVTFLDEGAGVVNTRGGVHYVVTEYGAVNLHGKTLRERALALINIAHPRFRDQLLAEAKRLQYLFEDQLVAVAGAAPYPERWEATHRLAEAGEVMLRPVLPTDERLVREFFHSLPRRPGTVRFLSVMKVFPSPDLKALINVDYDREITVVAIYGPLGAERVVGVGRYVVDPETNLAEVDVAVSPEWPAQGLGSLLLDHLIAIAQEKGVAGFVAYIDASDAEGLRLFEQSGRQLELSSTGEVVQVAIYFRSASPATGTDLSE